MSLFLYSEGTSVLIPNPGDVSSISQKTKEEDKSAQNLGAKLDTQVCLLTVLAASVRS